MSRMTAMVGAAVLALAFVAIAGVVMLQGSAADAGSSATQPAAAVSGSAAPQGSTLPDGAVAVPASGTDGPADDTDLSRAGDREHEHDDEGEHRGD